MAGEFFFDLIFHHLPRLPRLGEELKTDNFALALGGGAVNTALTVARLGRRVELASAVGDTVLDSFALSELRRGKVNTRSVRQEKGSMGAITVSVSLRRDRYFLTYMGANAAVERHLLSAALRRRFGRARHVHFGLSRVSASVWVAGCRLLQSGRSSPLLWRSHAPSGPEAVGASRSVRGNQARGQRSCGRWAGWPSELCIGAQGPRHGDHRSR
jgi:hypothetical protein